MTFDYEAVTWGGGPLVRVDAHDFLEHSLHLRHALRALRGAAGRVLEVGCGSGRFIASVAAVRPDLELHACDLSETALRVARARDGTVAFAQAAAEALPYPSDSFNAVLMIDVLEHLEDLEAGLREVRRVLTPGGILHLVFPCERAPGTLLWALPALRRFKRQHAGHLHQISRAALAQALDAQGFVPQRWRYSYHALGQLYDAAIFTALGFGLDVHGARHAHIESARRGGIARLRAVVSRVLYGESRLLARVPGMTAHVTCVTR